MKPGQVLDELFLRASLLRDQVESMGEPIAERTFKEIIAHRLTGDY